ncbi:hypothetical protein CVT26_011617 [Gymnopilus dilepis]|uniref:Uncharacterized protein n=1 Tax=Gymnopilus dilepis TaxID=231916 RepID=A0A409YQK6_9AGAR|nr:hypothetical protein CVT26_011617 [Gymnopilus dilepis]
MSCLSRHLPIITNRIRFVSVKLAPPPVITQRIDFAGMWVYDREPENQNSASPIGPAQRVSPELQDNEMDPGTYTTSSDESEISDDEDECRKIPKPQGEPGRPRSGGYTLKKVLRGWGDDLKIITGFVKEQADLTLDTATCYKSQPALAITAICETTAKRFPVLDKYENNWPVRDILKAHLKYKTARRGSRKARL